MTSIIDGLVDRFTTEAQASPRFIIAIAGAPGSGKSTLAEELLSAVREKGFKAQVLPMDGFHMDNAILQERGLLARKGAPETFDVRGFIDVITAVREAKEEVLVPVFDRDRELAIASARAIDVDTQIVIVEGNYLLLNEEPWSRARECFDRTVFVNPGEAVLRERLIARWKHYDMAPAVIDAKVEGNDMPNGRRVIANSTGADFTIDEW